MKTLASTDLWIGTQLGSGFFGTVHEGTLRPHGAVAVKRLDCAKMEQLLNVPKTNWPVFSSRLYQEAEALKAARHPNVLEVHAVHHDPAKDNVFIVTELCDSSLESAIKNGPAALASVARYARHALAGLECMHVRGLLHRDLKPANLLLKNEIAKLSDFGLVTSNLVAGYGSQAGYTEHLAPEVLEIGGVTSTQSDVWAMGMTIYRLLNGEPWYREVQRRLGIDTGRDRVQALQRAEALIKGGGFAKRLEFMPHVPDAWKRFVRKSMHDDRKVRYADATAMLSAMSSLDLPTEPSFECDMTDPSVVRWTRARDGRVEVVEWERGATADAFGAFTAPSSGASGHKHTLLKRQTAAPKKAAQALQGFFATRTK